MSLLGPQGANARLEELQAKIEQYSAKLNLPTNLGGTGNLAGNFAGALQGAIGAADPSQFSVNPSQLTAMASTAAQKYGIDPKVFSALVNTESGWNPAATSKVGAQGLTQLMPATAQALGVTNPMDPSQSLEGGAKYLKQMLDQFGGNYSKALAAYNAGPGAVEKAGGIPPYQETIAYVKKILGQAQS